MKKNPDWGSLLSRVEQFSKRESAAPTWSDFFREAGLLGHFVADASQPFHLTKNYDGWDNGHGGIHAYYEGDLVNELSPQALTDIIEKARTLKKEFTQASDVFSSAKKLGELSFNEVEEILQKDIVIKKSELKSERGMDLKQKALRKPASEVVSTYRTLLLTQLARGAFVLAKIWDVDFEANQKLTNDSPRDFEFFNLKPEVIMPHFLETESVPKINKTTKKGVASPVTKRYKAVSMTLPISFPSLPGCPSGPLTKQSVPLSARG